jgi:hypothetical protein
MKKGVLLFLFLFNCVLLYTLWQKKTFRDQLEIQVAAEPPVDIYFDIGERVARNFGEFTKIVAYKRFANSSLKLNDVLRKWEISYEDQNDSADLFNNSITPNHFQDSLWAAIEGYRMAIDGVLSVEIPKRKEKRAMYDQLKALLDQKRSREDIFDWKKEVDSTVGALGFYVDVRDTSRLNSLVQSLDYQSDPVMEFHINTLLNKFDNMVVSKGKFILYDHDFVMGEMNVLEERNLRHRLIMLKYSIERHLQTISSK